MAFFALALCALALCADGQTAQSAEKTLNGHTFTLPDGFDIECVAGPPLVDRPITADFDEQGRLYVSDSSGSNDKVDKQLAERPHRILRLEDQDGDGVFDTRTVFADKMMFPEGTMWYRGSLYVAAPPSIWKLTDTDGDGIADQRSEWFQGKTLTGCANDLHGPYLGPDGRIYWAKGAFAEQTYERPGRKPLVTKAAHLFRCRPDGSEIESVMTGGMDNPVDVVFTPSGERVFSTTFLQHPALGRRDGLIHAIYGGVYGKVHAVLDNHQRTHSEVMPVLSHLGAAAPCGLARLEGNAWGPDYRDNLFTACFNMQKVTRHVLAPEGASYRSTDFDFVVSANRDFHPTDVLDDADGSLLIVDTGGWYKLCCPTSQLWKPDILGGIYRVRKVGASRVADPRGRGIRWSRQSPANLAQLLDDPRPAVRKRAIQELGERGKSGLTEIAHVAWRSDSVEARRNAIWAASRIDDPGARELTRPLIADSDFTVRQCAVHAAGLWRDTGALSQLIVCLKDTASPEKMGVARAAAEALGRIGNSAAIQPLLEAAPSASDRALEHSIIYALIEINDSESTREYFASRNPNPVIRRAGLIALDQMERGDLVSADVLPHLSSSHAGLKQAASWISGRHPSWGYDLAGYLAERLAQLGRSPIPKTNSGANASSPAAAAPTTGTPSTGTPTTGAQGSGAQGSGPPSLEAEDQDELIRLLATFAPTTEIQRLLADQFVDPRAPRIVRETVLRSMAQSSLKELPQSWFDLLVRQVGTSEPDELRLLFSVARSIPAPKTRAGELNAALTKVAQHSQLPNTHRLEAATAVVGGISPVTADLFQFMLKHLDSDQPVALRIAAADVLSRGTLNSDQLTILADSMRNVGPLEADRLLGAFEKSTDQQIGLRLIEALRDSKALSSLRVDALKQRLVKYGDAIAPQAEQLYSVLNVDADKQRTRLEETLATIKDGDIRRGQAIFNSAKTACAACHSIGYLGGKIGPDLTRIAQVRQERDLLESVLFPSASLVRSYEPVLVEMADGRVINGLISKETQDELTLTVSATETVKVLRHEIDEIRPSKVSIMPAGLDQQLTPQQLADLIAFLKACK